MNSYERGRSAEYRVKKMLQNRGYLVLRSAGSHSPVDLLASNGRKKLAVQVKVRGSISSKEREELCKWAEVFDAKPMLARRRKNRWLLEEFH